MRLQQAGGDEVGGCGGKQKAMAAAVGGDAPWYTLAAVKIV